MAVRTSLGCVVVPPSTNLWSGLTLALVLVTANAAIGVEPTPAANSGGQAEVKPDPKLANLSPAEKRKVESADELAEKSNEAAKTGKFADGIALLKEAVELRREVLGDNHVSVADTLEKIAHLANRQNKPADAQSYFEESLEIRKTASGPRSVEVARTYNYIGLALAAQLKPVEAKEAYAQAMSIVKERNNGKNVDVALIHMNLGALHRAARDLKTASEHYSEALALRKAILGENQAATAEALTALGIVAYSQFKYGDSVTHHQQALAIRQKLPDSPRDLAAALNNLAGALRENGQLAEAQTRGEEALAAVKAAYGEKHVETSTALLALGGILQRRSRYQEAKPFLEQAVALRKEIFGEKSLAVAEAHFNLAMLLRDLNQRVEARQQLEQAQDIRKQAKGEEATAYADILLGLGDLAPDPLTARHHYQHALELYERLQGKKTLIAARTLGSLGQTYQLQGEYGVAQSFFQQAYDLRRELVGERNPILAFSLHDLASVLTELGKYSEANQLSRRALTLRQEVLGPKHALTAHSLNTVGLAEMDAGKYDAARACFEQALAILQETYGRKNPSTAVALTYLGRLEQRQGNYQAARALFEEVLAIRESLPDAKESESVANAQADLGGLAAALGKDAEALAMYEQQLAILTKRLGPKHKNTTIALQNLTTAHKNLGNYPEARKCCEQGLAIRIEVLGEKHPWVAGSLLDLGSLHQSSSDFKTAEEMIRRALAIRQDAFGDHSPHTSAALVFLGSVLSSQGDYRGARTLYDRAVAIDRALFGDQSLNAANGYSNLGSLSRNLGDYTAAEENFRKCLAIRQRILGEKHPLVGRVLAELGGLARDEDNYQKSKELFQQAFDIHNAAYGEKHPATALAMSGRAGAMQMLGEVEAAEKDHLRVLAIRKQLLGEKHPLTAFSLSRLGELHRDNGREAEAGVELKQAVAIYKSIMPERHPLIATGLGELSMLEARTGELQAAVATEDESRRIVRAHAARTLPGLSDKEQLIFLEHKDRQPLQQALSLGLLTGADPKLATTSAAWALNAKSVAQESLAQSTLIARDMRNKSVAGSMKELLDVRRELASLTLRTPESGQEVTYKKRLQELTSQEERLARRLSESGATVSSSNPWIEVAALRQTLGAESVLIEISRFQKFNFKATKIADRWQDDCYAAWVIPGRSDLPVRVVDLGSAKKIEDAVNEVRKSLQVATGTPSEPGLLQNLGEVEAEKAHLKKLAALADLVLRPIEPHLKEAKQLVVSPDAALWLVPWSALPTQAGEYLIEKFQIEYAISGRDVVQKAVSKGSRRRPVVFANPDFDARLAASKPDTDPAHEQFRSLGSLKSLPRVARLPGTATEARIITPNLEKFTADEALLFTEATAVESAFKALRQPRVLVLSTHGFFLEDQRAQATGHSGDETRAALMNAEGKTFENPLLRCGLLLAGCNQRGDASGAGDDGILTGMEILGADLRGTELVVLSACETGVGQIRNGEGVAGLRQAFQLAGARAVVSTLWQIPDRETAKVMNEFFTNLAANQTKADALRNAQLALIKSRRDRLGAAHPLFWAAFTITGR